ncbi:MAG: recombinase family protein [Bacteroidales bacterium]|nr:recombinase family protein [Bacteroidales bacterium]
MKVAIYARVSTKTKGQDVENQLMILREFCIKMGYEVTKEYTDQESGRKSDRPAFIQLFSDAAKRKFDLLLFWSLDRFSREGTRKTIFYLQQLDDYGILYKSYSEQYLDSSGIFKDVIISILATLAKQEQIRLSERVRAGLEKAKSKGRVGGRPRIPQEVIDQILVLNQQGLSMRKIGTAVNIHHRTVAQYLIQD